MYLYVINAQGIYMLLQPSLGQMADIVMTQLTTGILMLYNRLVSL